MNPMNHWSLKQYLPRQDQIEIITEIADAINMDYEYIILEAGTGIGKSAIATTIADWYGDSYILTMTKQLQKQYLDDYASMVTEIKGRGNYPCKYGSFCDECYLSATELKPKLCDDCKYKKAKLEALASKHIITNYHYLWFAGQYDNSFLKRKLLILDEAHRADSFIKQMISHELGRGFIIRNFGIDIFDHVRNGGKLTEIQAPEYWIGICERLIDLVKKEYENPKNADELNKKGSTIKKYSTMIDELENIEDWVIDLPTKKAIINEGELEYSNLTMSLKPLNSSEYSDVLFDNGDVKLFMTGTLGGKKAFCKQLGIPEDDVYYIFSKSPFPKENRPVYTSYVKNMSGITEGVPNWKDPTAINMVNNIINSYSKVKGVIHTASNQQSWFIKKSLEEYTDRPIIIVDSRYYNREDSIRMFENNKKPAILIGAGVHTGVDFKDDKCRFQIIYKLPFPYLGDVQTNILRQRDPEWYIRETVLPLEQAYGRGVRGIDDYCDCYVIDESLEGLLEKNSSLFNDYFLEAVTDCEGVAYGK